MPIPQKQPRDSKKSIERVFLRPIGESLRQGLSQATVPISAPSIKIKIQIDEKNRSAVRLLMGTKRDGSQYEGSVFLGELRTELLLVARWQQKRAKHNGEWRGYRCLWGDLSSWKLPMLGSRAARSGWRAKTVDCLPRFVSNWLKKLHRRRTFAPGYFIFLRYRLLPLGDGRRSPIRD